MADVTITKVSGDPTFYSDIYKELKVGDSVTFSRRPGEIPNMQSISNGIAAGELTMSIAYTANELSSGIAVPTGSVQAADLAPVAAATAAAAQQTMRFPVAAGGAAEAILIAANAFPYKARILEAYMLVSTAVGASTAVLRTQAGGGTTIATFDTGTTGRKEDAAVTASVLVTPGALVGLFLTRSDAGVAGEVVIELRAET